MKKFARFVVFSVSLLIFSAVANSQGRGISTTPAPINGVVLYDADNKPAPRIQVQVLSIAGSPIDTYFTGSDGKFSTLPLVPGQYVVKIEIEGFVPFRESVEIMGYPGVRLNISLKAVAPEKSVIPGNLVSARELGLPHEAQSALHQGTEKLFQKRDPAASLPFFQKVLVMAPDFYEAAYYQGVALMELGRKKEAEDAFKNAASLSDDKFPEADFALASLMTDQQQYSEAEKLVRAGLLMAPGAWNGLTELARVQLATNRLADAEQSALDVRKAKPDFPRIYLLLANIHQKQGKNEAVLDDLNTYLKMFPNGAYVSQVKAMKEQTEKALGRTPTPNELL